MLPSQKLLFNENQCICLNPCDLLINEKDRNLKNFIELTKPIFGNKDYQEKEVFIMCPNETSVNLYKKLYMIKPLCPLQIKLMPLPNILKSHGITPPGAVKKLGLLIFKLIKRIIRIDICTNYSKECYYEFLNGIDYQDTYFFDRGHEWHKWRFSDESGCKYIKRYFYVDNKLVGYFIARVIEKTGQEILALIDIKFKHGRPRPLTQLIALVELLELGFIHENSAILFIGLGLKKLSKLFYYTLLGVPERLRPFSIDFFVIGKNQEIPDTYRQDNWILTAADLDIF